MSGENPGINPEKNQNLNESLLPEGIDVSEYVENQYGAPESVVREGYKKLKTAAEKDGRKLRLLPEDAPMSKPRVIKSEASDTEPAYYTITCRFKDSEGQGDGIVTISEAISPVEDSKPGDPSEPIVVEE